MQPSEVRQHVLADHEQLRQMLAQLDELTRAVLGGAGERVGPMRSAGEALLTRLAEHMRWEDRYLARALREADAWGEERCALLAEDHRHQREILETALAHLREDSRPAQRVATELAELVAMLRADMVEEEQALLDERVLRDDVVAIDVEAG